MYLSRNFLKELSNTMIAIILCSIQEECPISNACWLQWLSKIDWI